MDLIHLTHFCSNTNLLWNNWTWQPVTMKRVQGLMGSCVMCAIQIHQSAGEKENEEGERQKEREIKKRRERTSGPWRRCQLRAWVGLAPGWIAVSPSARFSSLKAWHCQRGKKHHFIILCHSHPLFPCQTCHMSPSQGVLPAYRVWQGHSYTAPNHTLSPAGRILLWRHRAVMDCQGEGSDFRRVTPQTARESREDRGCNRSSGVKVRMMIMWPRVQTRHWKWITPNGPCIPVHILYYAS